MARESKIMSKAIAAAIEGTVPAEQEVVTAWLDTYADEEFVNQTVTRYCTEQGIRPREAIARMLRAAARQGYLVGHNHLRLSIEAQAAERRPAPPAKTTERKPPPKKSTPDARRKAASSKGSVKRTSRAEASG